MGGGRLLLPIFFVFTCFVFIHTGRQQPPIASLRTMNADKSLIQRRFTHALSSYEAAARMQAEVAEALLAGLAATLPRLKPDTALEISCATGILTEKILARWPGLARLVVCDLVPGFAACIAAKSPKWPLVPAFLSGDIEELPIPGQFDCILSSSTLQWVHDFPALAAKLGRHLNPGGILAIALYGPDNFYEIRELTGSGLSYLSLAELQDILARHFQILLAREQRSRLHFASPLDLLRHLRDTGVNALCSPAGWTKGRLARFAEAYQAHFAENGGVRLTAHPLYLVAQKNGQTAP